MKQRAIRIFLGVGALLAGMYAFLLWGMTGFVRAYSPPEALNAHYFEIALWILVSAYCVAAAWFGNMNPKNWRRSHASNR